MFGANVEQPVFLIVTVAVNLVESAAPDPGLTPRLDVTIGFTPAVHDEPLPPALAGGCELFAALVGWGAD